jgi:uncharacterized protein
VKVVFDTNILVSALVFPGGRGEAALRRILEALDQLVISKPILDELLRVLGSKFARDSEESRVLQFFVWHCPHRPSAATAARGQG